MSLDPAGERFAAKLLFQFRVEVKGKSNRLRITEERIIVFHAKDSESALNFSNRIGESEEVEFKNNENGMVFIEFIGVRDLMHLGSECDEYTVWYEIKNMLEPMERKNSLIPSRDDLSAFIREKRLRQEKRQ